MPLPQSQIQVNKITGRNGNDAVIIAYGASVTSGQVFSVAGDINVAGIITATNFVGNGSNLTGLNIATASRAIALNIIA
jgi:triosephosphate isomerase